MSLSSIKTSDQVQMENQNSIAAMELIGILKTVMADSSLGKSIVNAMSLTEAEKSHRDKANETIKEANEKLSELSRLSRDIDKKKDDLKSEHEAHMAEVKSYKDDIESALTAKKRDHEESVQKTIKAQEEIASQNEEKSSLLKQAEKKLEGWQAQLEEKEKNLNEWEKELGDRLHNISEKEKALVGKFR